MVIWARCGRGSVRDPMADQSASERAKVGLQETDDAVSQREA
jgi:hypothetical protein